MPFINLLEIARKLIVFFVNAAVFLNIVSLCTNDIHFDTFSYESFIKEALTWQDNTSPCTGATTGSNEGGAEVQDKPSARHRAKGTALGAITAGNGVCCGGGVAPPYLGHGGRGIKRMLQFLWMCRRKRSGLSSSTG